MDEVNAPTGSDSGSLAQDTVTNDPGPKVIVTNVDLSELVDVASAAHEKYNIKKDITAQIRTSDPSPLAHPRRQELWLLRDSWYVRRLVSRLTISPHFCTDTVASL